MLYQNTWYKKCKIGSTDFRGVYLAITHRKSFSRSRLLDFHLLHNFSVWLSDLILQFSNMLLLWNRWKQYILAVKRREELLHDTILILKSRKSRSKRELLNWASLRSCTHWPKGNKVINYLKSLPSFWWEAFVEIIGKFIIFIRRKIINELHNFFVLC